MLWCLQQHNTEHGVQLHAVCALVLIQCSRCTWNNKHSKGMFDHFHNTQLLILVPHTGIYISYSQFLILLDFSFVNNNTTPCTLQQHAYMHKINMFKFPNIRRYFFHNYNLFYFILIRTITNEVVLCWCSLLDSVLYDVCVVCRIRGVRVPCK